MVILFLYEIIYSTITQLLWLYIYIYIYETIYSVISRKVQNIIFDALAKKAKAYIGLHVWLEDLPEDIALLFLFDVY